MSEPTNLKHCQSTYRHLPTGRSRYDPYSSVSTKWYYRENRKFSEQQLSIFKCWFKELEELNSTDNFKVKFVQIFFLSILITNYKSNPFNLGDWNMLKNDELLSDIINFFLGKEIQANLPLENFFLYLLRIKFGSHSILFRNGDEAKEKFSKKACK